MPAVCILCPYHSMSSLCLVLKTIKNFLLNVPLTLFTTNCSHHSPQSTVLHGTGSRALILPLQCCCVFALSAAFTSDIVKGTWGHGVKMEMGLIKLWEVREFFLIICVLSCTPVTCCVKPEWDVQYKDWPWKPGGTGNVQFALIQDLLQNGSDMSERDQADGTSLPESSSSRFL